MRHRRSGKKLGRNTSHRKAMMRNMVTSLFNHEKITTTDARAKELRKLAEKLITIARRGDLHSRRLVMQVVQDKKVVAKLFDTIAPRYVERPGGYTRIIKLGHRSGDNAALSLIELVEEELAAKPKKKKAEPKKAEKVVAPVVAAAAVEEAPVEEAPVEEAPVEEAPVEEAPVEEAPVEEAPVEEAPVEEAPAEEAPVEEAPAEEETKKDE